MASRGRAINEALITPISGFGNNCGLNCLVHVICSPDNIARYFGPAAEGVGLTAGQEIVDKFNELNPTVSVNSRAEMLSFIENNDNPYFRERMLGPVLRQLVIKRLDESMRQDNGLAKFANVIRGDEETGAFLAEFTLEEMRQNPSLMLEHTPLRWFAGTMGIHAMIRSQDTATEERLRLDEAGLQRAWATMVPRPIAAVTIVHDGGAHWEFLGKTAEQVRAHTAKIQDLTTEVFHQRLKNSIATLRSDQVRHEIEQINSDVLKEESMLLMKLIEASPVESKVLADFHDKWNGQLGSGNITTVQQEILVKELNACNNELGTLLKNGMMSVTPAYTAFQEQRTLRKELMPSVGQRLKSRAEGLSEGVLHSPLSRPEPNFFTLFLQFLGFKKAQEDKEKLNERLTKQRVASTLLDEKKVSVNSTTPRKR